MKTRIFFRQERLGKHAKTGICVWFWRRGQDPSWKDQGEGEKREKKPSCLRSSSLKTPIVNTSTTTRTWSVPQNTLWKHSKHTLNTVWTYLKICPRFDKISITLITHSLTWIQEMLAHLKTFFSWRFGLTNVSQWSYWPEIFAQDLKNSKLSLFVPKTSTSLRLSISLLSIWTMTYLPDLAWPEISIMISIHQQWTLTFDDYMLPIIARSIKLAKERAAGEHHVAISRKVVCDAYFNVS